MAATTRYIGWCPICEQDVKVRGGLIVHHGYRRPGVGYIIGDCPGVNFPPYETSTESCESYLKYVVVQNINDNNRVLRVLTRPEGPPDLSFENYDVATRRLVRDPNTGQPEMIRLTREQADALSAQLPSWDQDRYSWEKRLLVTIAYFESSLRGWERERDRIQRLIETWAPLPLRTIEEETRKQELSKREREDAKTLARNQKIQAEVEKIRRRIDSAVRNKNSSVLADIYTSEKLREVSGYRLSRDEGRALLERDFVWRAFGLGGPDDHAILEEMRWGRKVPSDRPGVRFDYAPLPWPEELGGGFAKVRR